MQRRYRRWPIVVAGHAATTLDRDGSVIAACGYSTDDEPKRIDDYFDCEECLDALAAAEAAQEAARNAPRPAVPREPMTPAEQMDLWLKGIWRCPDRRGECCPDFGCCNPRLRWTFTKRQEYARASTEHREMMMMESVQAVADSGAAARRTRKRANAHGPSRAARLKP